MDLKIFLFMCLCAVVFHVCNARRYRRRWSYRSSWSHDRQARASNYLSGSSIAYRPSSGAKPYHLHDEMTDPKPLNPKPFYDQAPPEPKHSNPYTPVRTPMLNQKREDSYFPNAAGITNPSFNLKNSQVSSVPKNAKEELPDPPIPKLPDESEFPDFPQFIGKPTLPPLSKLPQQPNNPSRTQQHSNVQKPISYQTHGQQSFVHKNPNHQSVEPKVQYNPQPDPNINPQAPYYTQYESVQQPKHKTQFQFPQQNTPVQKANVESSLQSKLFQGQNPYAHPTVPYNPQYQRVGQIPVQQPDIDGNAQYNRENTFAQKPHVNPFQNQFKSIQEPSAIPSFLYSQPKPDVNPSVQYTPVYKLAGNPYVNPDVPYKAQYQGVQDAKVDSSFQYSKTDLPSQRYNPAQQPFYNPSVPNNPQYKHIQYPGMGSVQYPRPHESGKKSNAQYEPVQKPFINPNMPYNVPNIPKAKPRYTAVQSPVKKTNETVSVQQRLPAQNQNSNSFQFKHTFGQESSVAQGSLPEKEYPQNPLVPNLYKNPRFRAKYGYKSIDQPTSEPTLASVLQPKSFNNQYGQPSIPNHKVVPANPKIETNSRNNYNTHSGKQNIPAASKFGHMAVQTTTLPITKVPIVRMKPFHGQYSPLNPQVRKSIPSSPKPEIPVAPVVHSDNYKMVTNSQKTFILKGSKDATYSNPFQKISGVTQNPLSSAEASDKTSEYSQALIDYLTAYYVSILTDPNYKGGPLPEAPPAFPVNGLPKLQTDADKSQSTELPSYLGPRPTSSFQQMSTLLNSDNPSALGANTGKTSTPHAKIMNDPTFKYEIMQPLLDSLKTEVTDEPSFGKGSHSAKNPMAKMTVGSFSPLKRHRSYLHPTSLTTTKSRSETMLMSIISTTERTKSIHNTTPSPITTDRLEALQNDPGIPPKPVHNDGSKLPPLPLLTDVEEEEGDDEDLLPPGFHNLPELPDFPDADKKATLPPFPKQQSTRRPSADRKTLPPFPDETLPPKFRRPASGRKVLPFPDVSEVPPFKRSKEEASTTRIPFPDGNKPPPFVRRKQLLKTTPPLRKPAAGRKLQPFPDVNTVPPFRRSKEEAPTTRIPFPDGNKPPPFVRRKQLPKTTPPLRKPAAGRKLQPFPDVNTVPPFRRSKEEASTTRIPFPDENKPPPFVRRKQLPKTTPRRKLLVPTPTQRRQPPVTPRPTTTIKTTVRVQSSTKRPFIISQAKTDGPITTRVPKQTPLVTERATDASVLTTKGTTHLSGFTVKPYVPYIPKRPYLPNNPNLPKTPREPLLPFIPVVTVSPHFPPKSKYPVIPVDAKFPIIPPTAESEKEPIPYFPQIPSLPPLLPVKSPVPPILPRLPGTTDAPVSVKQESGVSAAPCSRLQCCCKWEPRTDSCFNTVCVKSVNGVCVKTERQMRQGCSVQMECKACCSKFSRSCAKSSAVEINRSRRGACCGQSNVMRAWCCMAHTGSSCCLSALLTSEEMIAAQVQAEQLARIRVAEEAARLAALRTQRAAEQQELARLIALQAAREAEAREAADQAAVQAARAAELRETQARLAALTAQRQVDLSVRQEAARQAELARISAAETEARLIALREQREAELAAQQEAHRQAELAAAAQATHLLQLRAQEAAARNAAERAQTERDAALAAQSHQAVQLQAQQMAAVDAQREAGRLALLAAQRMCGSCGSVASPRAGCCSSAPQAVVVNTCCGGTMAIVTACCSAASHAGQMPSCCGSGAAEPLRTAISAAQRSSMCCGISTVARTTCCTSIGRMGSCC